MTDEHVPPRDPDYVFDRDTTLALLAGFMHNRRVMVPQTRVRWYDRYLELQLSMVTICV